jgi:cardiolipin synthase C
MNKKAILREPSTLTSRLRLKPSGERVYQDSHFAETIKPFWLLFLIFLLLAGCASVPTDYVRKGSMAFQDHASTVIGKRVAGMASAHPGESGFSIIRYPRPAFTSRIMMTDLAEKSLDVQYYIWEEDATGRILAERLVRAADRGVKVRLLVDDMNLSGRDAVIAAIDTHPNIEIRIFNPFAHRGTPGLDFITDIDRVNHRMHNKIMIMDNTLAIVGGRNIGNHYFGVDTEANFRDLDIAAAGPVVREISTAFDVFWNGDWSVPIEVLVDRPYTEDDRQDALATMRQRIAEDDYPYPLNQDVAALEAELSSIFGNLIWAPGQIIWDDPAAIYDHNQPGRIDKSWAKKLEVVQRELLIESAYFVVRERGVEYAKKLNARGVRMRVLTNSMISNDVLAAFAGYSKRRAELIENGVELYELRPDAGAVRKTDQQTTSPGKSKSALHTKAMVFDRQAVFIGSFNLDPRSADINTEAGLYVESPALAEQVAAYMDDGVKPENSYRVMLDEDGDLVWVTQTDGQEVRYSKDPGSSFWQRFKAGFIRLMPVEGQL